jgi:hypothetical protein
MSSGLSVSPQRDPRNIGAVVAIVSSVETNFHRRQDMTTASILLNVALGAGTSGLIATAMTVVPNLDRLRAAGRARTIHHVHRPQGHLGADLQPGS